ncbi:MAG: class I SAM-dependent methyltransferase [Limisphaerales bacterium]
MNGQSSVPDPRLAFFDRHAPTWDTQGPDPVAIRRRLEELNGRLGLGPGQSVLEIGCGTGQITGWLAATVRPGRVVALDFSPAMLAVARTRGIEAEFRQQDICLEGTTDERFDRVFCFSAFPHFRDAAAALREMARRLKPAGELVVLHLSGSRPLNAFHHGLGGAVGHDRLPAAAEWPELLRPAGLVAVEAIDEEDLFLVRAIPAARGS